MAQGQPTTSHVRGILLTSGLLTRVEDLVIVHLEATFMQDEGPQAVLKWLRQNFQGTLIAAGGFTKASAELALIEGYLDLVAFGAPFVSNPDLVARFKNDSPLTPPDRRVFYTPGP